MYPDWQNLWSLHQLFKYPAVKWCCYSIVSQHHPRNHLFPHHQPSSYKFPPWSWSRSPRMTIPWSLSSSSCPSINVTYDDNGDQKESSSNSSSHHCQHGILQDSIWGRLRWCHWDFLSHLWCHWSPIDDLLVNTEIRMIIIYLKRIIE